VKVKVSHLERAYARNLGDWIQETRVELGLSLGQMGERVGVHRNTVWRWELGLCMPNVYQYSLIRRLANKTGVAQ
jgi:transcriptional regulator with XRE-family HTH domain